MIKTLFIDLGGTVFIKNETNFAEKNPVFVFLNEHIPKDIKIVLVSDTNFSDIKDTLNLLFPTLRYDLLFTKYEYPWLDKNKPETFSKICEMISVDPAECVLIDDQKDFRVAAEVIGIRAITPEISLIKELCMKLKTP